MKDSRFQGTDTYVATDDLMMAVNATNISRATGSPKPIHSTKEMSMGRKIRVAS